MEAATSGIRAVLGSLIDGADGSEGKAKMEAATRSAHDLTGMVRKKEKKPVAAPGDAVGNVKRKASDVDGHAAAGAEKKQRST